MDGGTPISLTLLIIVFVTAAYYIYDRFCGSTRLLHGPRRPSFLLGHQYELLKQEQVGDLSSAWLREYGPTFSIGGCFGTDTLYMADPKGIQYVMQTAAYHFDKPPDVRLLMNVLVGRGILGADGPVHQRHRRILNQVFTIQQLRTVLPLFQHSAGRLTQRWKSQIEDGTRTFNVCRWLGRITLDALGDAAFDYQFGALDDAHNELAKSFETLIYAPGVRASKGAVLFRAVCKYLPSPMLRLMACLPTPTMKRFSQFKRLCQSIAADLIREKSSSMADSTSRDAMSVLARSNQAEDEKKRLDDEEVLSQMATLMLAGHETTASTLSWMFYELARHVDDQQKIRDEIKALRARPECGDEFSMADLDSLPFTNACIKETLRLYPFLSALPRVALRDDVIPLHTPATSVHGDKVSQVVVRKGQELVVSIYAYNRLPSLWGDDSDEWRPSRFLDQSMKDGHASAGVFANLMTFSAGARSCIGWRFALLEIQTILVELVEHFRFLLPDGVEIQRVPAGPMVPMVKGKLNEGQQIPLEITVVE